MLFERLLRPRSKGVTTTRHSLPPGERVYAIGDIHGRLDLLDELIGKIEEDEAQRGELKTTLIFLGDLVDRGPDSRGVVERVLQLSKRRPIRVLRGNHEEVFLKAVRGDQRATRFLVRIGGVATILSYGFDEDEYRALSFEELTPLLAERVPREHVEFLDSFEQWIEMGDYLFVHAGVRPGLEMAEQSAADLCWIRDEFLLDRTDHGKMVVHGHSITDKVDLQSNRIGIDTGAFSSGRLTALGLQGRERWFLST